MKTRLFLIKPPGRDTVMSADEHSVDAKVDELSVHSHFFGELDVRYIEIDTATFDSLPKYVKPTGFKSAYNFD